MHFICHIFYNVYIYMVYGNVSCVRFIIFKTDFIYLFLQRGKEGEREGEKHQCVVASRAPYWGPGPQPTHVP